MPKYSLIFELWKIIKNSQKSVTSCRRFHFSYLFLSIFTIFQSYTFRHQVAHFRVYWWIVQFRNFLMFPGSCWWNFIQCCQTSSSSFLSIVKLFSFPRWWTLIDFLWEGSLKMKLFWCKLAQFNYIFISRD